MAAMLSDPAAALHWPPDVARYNFEAVLFSSSGWLRTACVVLALFWYASNVSSDYMYTHVPTYTPIYTPTPYTNTHVHPLTVPQGRLPRIPGPHPAR